MERVDCLPLKPDQPWWMLSLKFIEFKIFKKMIIPPFCFSSSHLLSILKVACLVKIIDSFVFGAMLQKFGDELKGRNVTILDRQSLKSTYFFPFQKMWLNYWKTIKRIQDFTEISLTFQKSGALKNCEKFGDYFKNLI